MTWATIYYFSFKPRELLGGIQFTFILLMIFTSIAITSINTTRVLLQHLWALGKDEDKQSSSNTSGNTSKVNTQPWWRSRLLMIPMLCLLVLASLLLHGGAVAADLQLLRRWYQWRASVRKQPWDKREHALLEGRIKDSQDASREVHTLLALLFGTTSVPVSCLHSMCL